MADARDVTWRFINVAPIIANQPALDELFAATLQPFGIDRFDCIQLDTDRPTEFPSILSDHGMLGWMRYFFEQGYNEIDPCLPVSTRMKGPYTWSDVKALTPHPTRSPVWSDAWAGGMREGLVVPTGTRGLNGAIVRLITPEERLDPDALPLLQSISVIYASTAQSFGPDTLDKPRKTASTATLTDREIECLFWSARGKTNAEIGVILEISRHTVNTHIESAKRKLGVATRVQAAVIAHRLGLLSLA